MGAAFGFLAEELRDELLTDTGLPLRLFCRVAGLRFSGLLDGLASRMGAAVCSRSALFDFWRRGLGDVGRGVSRTSRLANSLWLRGLAF